MPLAPDNVQDWKERHMGTVKPMFNIEIMPHVEADRLRYMEPVRQAGIVAAQVYLDAKDKAVTHVKGGVIMPIAIMMIAVASLALIAWGMK